MAVFTEVPFEAAHGLIARLGIGELQRLEGCPGGIENTNYFADTTTGRYVLTLFERLGAEQLPFYLHYMKHLAQRAIPVPDPQADAQGEILHQLLGKPAAVVNRLRGRHRLAPDAAHCAAVGAMLAKMHLAGQDFALQQPNLRGLAWWNETVPVVLPFLDPSQRALIEQELQFQQQVAASPAYARLPAGPVHADLFRDNVMFDDSSGSDELSGFFDFYFAGVDRYVFDIAVCLNDWCIDLASGALTEDRAQAFMAAYDAVRRLEPNELRLLPAMMRAGALRFWTSRLWDFHLPRDASMLTAHDPGHFERVLRCRVEVPWHFERPTDTLAATPDAAPPPIGAAAARAN
jgi:homoserine kinase type II